MKKLFTLVLTLFILNAAFSQAFVSRFSVQTPNFGISYDRNYGNGYNNNYYNNDYERSCAVQRINAEYYQNVQQVMCLQISAERKTQLISQLQREKARKLRRLNRHFGYGGGDYSYQPYNNYDWRR